MRAGESRASGPGVQVSRAVELENTVVRRAVGEVMVMGASGRVKGQELATCPVLSVATRR